MAENLDIPKADIKKFLETEFPGHQYKIGDGYWFVNAGKHINWTLHYEYNNGQVHFDIEGSMWREPRNFFRCKITDSHLKPHHWWRNDCRWTRDVCPESWEDVKQAFKTLHTIMTPYVQEWEDLKNESIKASKKTIETRVSSMFVTVGKMLSNNLKIPNYQRPYVWEENNVEQLLNDIYFAKSNGKKEYLIGSIILHNDKKNSLAIVDGQQRITTILLLLKAMCAAIPGASEFHKGIEFPDLKFNHEESFGHIKINYEYIQTWIERNLQKSESAYVDFFEYVTLSCKFVQIVVTELSEAFQLFETQNGRGKELEAYNLLKAYHLRTMSEDSQAERKDCDVRWESAALFVGDDERPHDLLRQVINEHLFRTRIWTRGEDAGRFSKKDIDEFKGTTIDKGTPFDFAYQNIMLQQQIAIAVLKTMNQGLFKIKDRFIYGDPENMSPFASINQLIINGKPFFDYIETFVEIYKRLFIDINSSQLADFKKFYQEYCKGYEGASRTGDTYIRQVYKSAIMLVFDRFGEKGVMDIYRELYAVLYSYRLKYKQVRYSTMMKHSSIGWLFKVISNAKALSDFAPIRLESSKLKNEASFPFEVKDIVSIIKSI